MDNHIQLKEIFALQRYVCAVRQCWISLEQTTKIWCDSGLAEKYRKLHP